MLIFFIFHPKEVYSSSVEFKLVSSVYGDEIANLFDDFIKQVKTPYLIGDQAKKYSKLIELMGSNIDDFSKVFSKISVEKRADIFLCIASHRQLISGLDTISFKYRLVKGEISEKLIIQAIKENQSLNNILKKFVRIVDDVSNDRYLISKPKFRQNRLIEQEKSKDLIRQKKHQADYKKRWEEANNKVCNGEVHHIIPLALVYGKNQSVEKVFDNCGEFYFDDSDDYIHEHRNTICILQGHRNHPNYSKQVESALEKIPLNFPREDSCKMIGEIRNCFRKQIENFDESSDINSLLDNIKIIENNITCFL